MLLAKVVETSRRISETSKRLEKTALLAGLLKELKPEEVETVAGFLAGAPRQGRIGIGYAALHSSMAVAAVDVATIEILDVDRILDEISVVRGAGSEQRKRALLGGLFARATNEEQHFLVRLLSGELRQGALEGILLDALAKASGISSERIRRAAMMAGGAAAIARAALEKGESGLSPFDIQLFRPVQPMLAQTAEDLGGALADLGEASLEYKLDGARIQVHKAGDQVAIFSRGANDVTAAVPEVVQLVRALPAHDLILDGEVLSLSSDGRPQPFQVSMRRFGRKLDVASLMDELPMTPFWFDLLYLNGSPLVDEAQAKRFAELALLAPSQNVIPNLVTGDPERAEEFLHQALAGGHEGVMAKSRAAGYAAGARGQSWLKVKRARTLDLVVLAAEWGSGRRRGFLSNLHLGARDTRKGGFAMLGKTFKGLTDEMLAWQTQELLKLEVARDSYTVYVEPKLVVEIAFNEIQASPRYVSGLALRFARVKRYRPDKSAADSDTFEAVQRLAGILEKSAGA
ncbi:MAG TPA: ATP-dependent DNA ligase [Bryobacteraceae bacterium]|jgi:DNA ligase-1